MDFHLIFLSLLLLLLLLFLILILILARCTNCRNSGFYCIHFGNCCTPPCRNPSRRPAVEGAYQLPAISWPNYVLAYLSSFFWSIVSFPHIYPIYPIHLFPSPFILISKHRYYVHARRLIDEPSESGSFTRTHTRQRNKRTLRR